MEKIKGRFTVREEGNVKFYRHRSRGWEMRVSKHDKDLINIEKLNRHNKGLTKEMKELGKSKIWYNYWQEDIGGSKATFYVHRVIVGIADKGNKGYEVHHLDGDTFNNERGNLFILTKKEHVRVHARGVSRRELDELDDKNRRDLGLVSRRDYLKGTGYRTFQESVEDDIKIKKKELEDIEERIKELEKDISDFEVFFEVSELKEKVRYIKQDIDLMEDGYVNKMVIGGRERVVRI